jgi:hypothetical protein
MVNRKTGRRLLISSSLQVINNKIRLTPAMSDIPYLEINWLKTTIELLKLALFNANKMALSRSLKYQRTSATLHIIPKTILDVSNWDLGI